MICYIKSIIPTSFKVYLKRRLRFYRVKKNIFNGVNRRTALISYLYEPFIYSEETRHSSWIEVRQIALALNDLGFNVDVVDCRSDVMLNDKYDVMIGFGYFFRNNYKMARNNILYLNGGHPDFLERAEFKRIVEFNNRSQPHAKQKRKHEFVLSSDLGLTDNIILLGNEYTRKTYSSSLNIYTINAPAIISPHFSEIKKSKNCQRNYLWFGSSGAIHKGLDIVIDFFMVNKNLNLFIAGLSKDEEYLFNLDRDNIHNIGFINVNSPEFNDLITNVGYMIHPSCSEGMSTSVLTCMSHGVIPIITRECGVSLPEGLGYFLDSPSLKSLTKVIDEIKTESFESYLSRSEQLFEYSRLNFSQSNFNRTMTTLLENILDERNEQD
ncbi:glycosyltransferase [Endozoicomonas elysicola]|uniref:Glycosyl transferase family 1 domain-containing protein n=1 Tax=Endozoicomonas elysicola TaxID=305900 RepID=A0A081KCS5_9GAMM|nr:glycosyltransferase [Endozoicomonas elysicola]KEI71951.1 hypothetical protein GV64_15525 [Endozoicomonas elysicola]